MSEARFPRRCLVLALALVWPVTPIPSIEGWPLVAAKEPHWLA